MKIRIHPRFLGRELRRNHEAEGGCFQSEKLNVLFDSGHDVYCQVGWGREVENVSWVATNLANAVI